MGHPHSKSRNPEEQKKCPVHLTKQPSVLSTMSSTVGEDGKFPLDSTGGMPVRGSPRLHLPTASPTES